MEKYKVLLSLIHPEKLANSRKLKLIENLSEDRNTGYLTFETNLSETEIKRKLGLPSKDIIVKVKEIKAEEKSETMDNQNQRVKIDIPVISKHGNFENLKVYTNDLLTFKEICSDWKDKEIIFATLSKSNMTHLRMSMSTEQQNDLEKYIEFMMKNFGISQNRVWSELREIKQRADESPMSFWYRLINLYYQARDMAPPTEITDNSQKLEIRNLYLNGILSEELKRVIFTKNIDFEKLAQETQNIYQALNDLKGVQKTLDVMSIRGRSSFRSNWRNPDYTGRSQSRSKSRERSQDRRVCYRCGRQGHIRQQCHASAKTVRRYKLFLQKHDSRSRSQSRDRQVTFQDQ